MLKERVKVVNKGTTIQFLSETAPREAKEALYLAVRNREGRVLCDEQVAQLPDKSPHPSLAKEWKWRRRSCARLLRRIKHIEKSRGSQGFKILDLGCGNGWMAARLAAQSAREVWAADLNITELEQGCRVFPRDNLHFVYGDILQDVFPAGYFDAVVMAASLQYFRDIQALLASIRRVLKPGGFLEIIDSPFYPSQTAQAAARERSRQYFRQVGYPEMIDYYHHHLPDGLLQSGGRDLNRSFWYKMLQKAGYYAPFLWIEWQNGANNFTTAPFQET